MRRTQLLQGVELRDGHSRVTRTVSKIRGVSQTRSPWWRRPQQPAAPTRYGAFHLQESALLPAPPAVVWAMVKPAENGPLFDPRISRGFQVPGTPDGLGEQQCMMLVDGTTSISEVIEYHESDGGGRAVTRQVSPPLPRDARTVHDVHAAPGGSVMVIRLELWAPTGAVWPAPYENYWHVSMTDYFQRARGTLTSATWSRCGLIAHWDAAGGPGGVPRRPPDPRSPGVPAASVGAHRPAATPVASGRISTGLAGTPATSSARYEAGRASNDRFRHDCRPPRGSDGRRQWFGHEAVRTFTASNSRDERSPTN